MTRGWSSTIALAAMAVSVAASAAEREAPSPRAPIVRPCTGCARYQVAPDGDDDHDGSARAPWATLQHAAEQVEPGDVVRVQPGRYRGFDLRRSGEPGRPIWFVAEPGVVVEGDNASTPDGINVEGASWVGIAGFRVTGASRAGIRAVDCHHVFLSGNEAVQNQRWGIFTGFCDDLVIEDNVAAGADDEHGIYVSNSADRPVVRRNHIYDNAQAGIHMNGDASEGGDGIISHAVVEQNVIFDVGKKGAAGINCDGVQSSVFRNNLIYRAHAAGLTLYRIDGGGGSKDNVVSNNTIWVAEDGRYALHLRGGSTGVRIRNNILFNDNPSRGALDVMPDCLAGLSSDHNVMIDRHTLDDWESNLDLDAWRARTGQDRASVSADPKAVFDGAAFALAASGPARDAGVGEGAPEFDLLGRARPLGAAIDVGALELCPAEPCNRVEPARATAMLGRLGPAPPPAAPRPGAAGGCAGCATAAPPGRSSGVLMLLLWFGWECRRRSLRR